MTLRVVGAGLGRTGTMSLKLALERLLGGPCYHMLEVLARPDHVAGWRERIHGEAGDWDALFADFDAAVDWPTAAFWEEIAGAYPDALILLSTRDTESWWRSCDRTIFEIFRTGPDENIEAWFDMCTDLLELRFTPDFLDPDTAMAAFEEHNARVRSAAPSERLLEWHPGDGWGPLCDALGTPVPDEPFPKVNTTEEFRSRAGWE